MNIHCFQHVEFEGLGSILNWINDKGHNLSYTRFYLDEKPPKQNDIDFLIVMGGPMSFDEYDKYPWMKGEEEYIKAALDNKKTMLGICLGAQFIANAIDGSAKHGHSREIGWFPIKMENTEVNGPFDPSLKNQTVFHWHGDTFNIPNGATRLASTNEYPNQAYLFNKNVIGLQFHLEMTKESAEGMIKYCGHELVKDTFVQNEKEILDGLKFVPENRILLFNLLNYLENQM